MKKNCDNCQLYINNLCCGRNDYYGKDTKAIFPNGCDNHEISFSEMNKNAENNEDIIDALLNFLDE